MWSKEMPEIGGVRWIQVPIKGSPCKYWQPFIALVRRNGEGIDVLRFGIIEDLYLGPNEGYLFSEEVIAPEV